MNQLEVRALLAGFTISSVWGGGGGGGGVSVADCIWTHELD